MTTHSTSTLPDAPLSLTTHREREAEDGSYQNVATWITNTNPASIILLQMFFFSRQIMLLGNFKRQNTC